MHKYGANLIKSWSKLRQWQIVVEGICCKTLHNNHKIQDTEWIVTVQSEGSTEGF